MSAGASAAPAAPRSAARSPLAQLLHALNQPLTGLQCSLEVALAMPRTPEQYTHGLRENLELTERMRALVEAIREVVDAQESDAGAERFDLGPLLGETVDEFAPVAESRNVKLGLGGALLAAGVPGVALEGERLLVEGERRGISGALFRLLDSALGLAARASCLQVAAGHEAGAVWIRVRWEPARTPAALSRAELGLLVAQAGFEQSGAQWSRYREEMQDTVTVQFKG